MCTDKCPVCVVSDLVFGGSQSQSDSRAKVVGNQIATEWQAVSILGEDISSESSRGKVALIVYWATWCAPCLEEIPALIALRNEFGHQDVDIIGVSLDQPSKDIDKFVSSREINYEIVRNTETLDKAFGPIRYIPTIVVLDRNGKVQQRYTGLVGKNVLQDQIETLLAKST
ncbi:MAG: TlpA disulfide reductase family protein [Verrucomicrobiota bacterium]|nr:TlpA disulfide reductase family protein [Verrucomicrobiota bacterium]